MYWKGVETFIEDINYILSHLCRIKNAHPLLYWRFITNILSEKSINPLRTFSSFTIMLFRNSENIKYLSSYYCVFAELVVTVRNVLCTVNNCPGILPALNTVARIIWAWRGHEHEELGAREVCERSASVQREGHGQREAL